MIVFAVVLPNRYRQIEHIRLSRPQWPAYKFKSHYQAQLAMRAQIVKRAAHAERPSSLVAIYLRRLRDISALIPKPRANIEAGSGTAFKLFT